MIEPLLEGIGRLTRASALRMRFDFIRRSISNVQPPATGSPTGPMIAPEVFVCIGDPAVMLGLKFVLRCARRRITAKPELIHEHGALSLGVQALKGLAFFLRDDVCHIFVHPFRKSWVAVTKLRVAG